MVTSKSTLCENLHFSGSTTVINESFNFLCVLSILKYCISTQTKNSSVYCAEIRDKVK